MSAGLVNDRLETAILAMQGRIGPAERVVQTLKSTGDCYLQGLQSSLAECEGKARRAPLHSLTPCRLRRHAGRPLTLVNQLIKLIN